jgi:hypothetical protein
MAAGHKWFQPRPFLIIEVAGVETGIHGGNSRDGEQPASASAAQHETYSESAAWVEQ